MVRCGLVLCVVPLASMCSLPSVSGSQSLGGRILALLEVDPSLLGSPPYGREDLHLRGRGRSCSGVRGIGVGPRCVRGLLVSRGPWEELSCRRAWCESVVRGSVDAGAGVWSSASVGWTSLCLGRVWVDRPLLLLFWCEWIFLTRCSRPS